MRSTWAAVSATILGQAEGGKASVSMTLGDWGEEEVAQIFIHS